MHTGLLSLNWPTICWVFPNITAICRVLTVAQTRGNSIVQLIEANYLIHTDGPITILIDGTLRRLEKN